MGSWMTCKCGGLVHLNMFSGTHIYQLVEDSDYDAVEDPIDRDKLEGLFFRKGVTVYRCHSCGRLLIEWDDKDGLSVYLPEGKMQIPGTERASRLQDLQEAGQPSIDHRAEEPESPEGNVPDDPQLKELEALAEAAYDEMYDSVSPTGCYSRAKEALYSAIELADRLGRRKDAERLQKRLQHIKDVFRHQFSS